MTALLRSGLKSPFLSWQHRPKWIHGTNPNLHPAQKLTQSAYGSGSNP